MSSWHCSELVQYQAKLPWESQEVEADGAAIPSVVRNRTSSLNHGNFSSMETHETHETHSRWVQEQGHRAEGRSEYNEGKLSETKAKQMLAYSSIAIIPYERQTYLSWFWYVALHSEQPTQPTRVALPLPMSSPKTQRAHTNGKAPKNRITNSISISIKSDQSVRPLIQSPYLNPLFLRHPHMHSQTLSPPLP
jgi:hypothetical protein